MGAFLCQHEASKIKNTIVRNSFSAVVYTACNITHTIEKPIAALSVSSENILFFRWFYVTCQCPKFQMSRNQMIQIITEKKINMNKINKEIFIDILTSSDIAILKAFGLFVCKCNIS